MSSGQSDAAATTGRHTSTPLPPDHPDTPHPRFEHPLVRIAAFMVVFAAIGGMGVGLAYAFDSTGPAEGVGMVVSGLGLIIGATVAYVLMVRLLERRHPYELGLR